MTSKVEENLVKPRITVLPNGLRVRSWGDAWEELMQVGRYAGGKKCGPMPRLVLASAKIDR